MNLENTDTASSLENRAVNILGVIQTQKLMWIVVTELVWITIYTMMVNFCKTLYESSSFEEYFGQSNFIYLKRNAAAEIFLEECN